MHLSINAATPEVLILNLRAYPSWLISSGCPTCRSYRVFTHVQRDDGLLAIDVPKGQSTIDITWHRTLDQRLGLLITAFALAVFAALTLHARSRRIEVNA